MIEQEIIDGLDRGATVVTATRRLSRWLQAENDKRRWRAGDVAWTPPEIVPWPIWLEKCWLRLRDWGRIEGDKRILNERQETLLWRRILEDLPAMSHVLMPGDLAAEAVRAWALMQHYEIALDTVVKPPSVRHHSRSAALIASHLVKRLERLVSATSPKASSSAMEWSALHCSAVSTAIAT